LQDHQLVLLVHQEQDGLLVEVEVEDILQDLREVQVVDREVLMQAEVLADHLIIMEHLELQTLVGAVVVVVIMSLAAMVVMVVPVSSSSATHHKNSQSTHRNS
jgi:hypothetical protein